MAELRVAFRLPPALERAVFVSDYGLRAARLLLADRVALETRSHQALTAGVSAVVDGRVIKVLASGPTDVRLWVDGVEATREDRLHVPTSRSAWLHAWLALSGSALGLVASWLYVRRAEGSGDPWAMKMAIHMAVWHLLLSLTLFPASVWGQRAGIRAVQGVAVVFFVIHANIGIANLAAGSSDGLWISLLNGSSGLMFLVTALYGQRAHADMNPLGDRSSCVGTKPPNGRALIRALINEDRER